MLQRQANPNSCHSSDLNFNPTCSVPRYDGPLTLRRFGPISIGGGSLVVFPNSSCNLSFLWCSCCLLVASSLAIFLYLMEMGMLLPLANLPLKALSGASLWLVGGGILEFDSSLRQQSDSINCPHLPSGWTFFSRLSPYLNQRYHSSEQKLAWLEKIIKLTCDLKLQEYGLVIVTGSKRNSNIHNEQMKNSFESTILFINQNQECKCNLTRFSTCPYIDFRRKTITSNTYKLALAESYIKLMKRPCDRQQCIKLAIKADKSTNKKESKLS